MNTQNNEHDRLVDLLAAASHDDISDVMQTHLKNRFGDQEVIDAVIDYASSLTQARSLREKPTNYSDGTFTGTSQGKLTNYGDGKTFTGTSQSQLEKGID